MSVLLIVKYTHALETIFVDGHLTISLAVGQKDLTITEGDHLIKGKIRIKVTIFQKLKIGTFHRGRHNFQSRPSKDDSVNRLGSLNISKFSGLYHFKLLIWPMVNLYQQCLKAVNINKNMVLCSYEYICLL